MSGLIDAFLEPENVALERLPRQRFPAFSMPVMGICHKTWAPLVPLSSHRPCPRQRILGITPGLCFLGNLSHLWLAAGYLLGVSASIESCKWVTLFRVSIWHDRRTVLYAGSRLGGRHARVWSHDLRPFPFWASLITGVGWFSMTTPQRTFTCVVHSHLLNGVTLSGSAFTAFPSRF